MTFSYFQKLNPSVRDEDLPLSKSFKKVLQALKTIPKEEFKQPLS